MAAGCQKESLMSGFASSDIEQPLRRALEDDAAREAFASKAQAVRQSNAPESLRPVFLDLMGSL